MDAQPENDDGIAVIGIDCRFPGAPDKERFWDNLLAGRMSRKWFTKEEILAAGVPESELENPDHVACGYTIDGIDCFDAGFFDYSEEEAKLIDPQQRLYLQANWAALEDAGYTPDTYGGSIGVFAGSRMSSYMFGIQDKLRVMGSKDLLQTLMGNDKDYLTSRISYKLNLKGPSIAVQTACSSSLVAIHMACESLLSNQCDMALAGGVAVSVPNTGGYIYQNGMLFSSDGVCRPFDADAGGTVFGDGLGVVVLKELSRAQADGDHIYAVIRGTAVNNDGARKIGYTAPSVKGQMAVIDEALAVSGIDPATIGYIEAHSTATPLGDPIEFEALRRVYETLTDKRQFCAIGSVKSNIGHLEAAAGIASFIKTALMLSRKRLVPSINFKNPNPQINFTASPFYVQTASESWHANGTPLRAGVNSFGIGGSNAHVILESPPPRQASPHRPKDRQVLLPLSARTAAALTTLARDYSAALDRADESDLADIAMTAAMGRQPLEHRLAVTGGSVRDLRHRLDRYAKGDTGAGITRGRARENRPRVAFLFTGQGAQYSGMGQSLYNRVKPFRTHIDRCAQILSKISDVSLPDLLFDNNDAIHGTAEAALFALEYALANTLMEWGIRPDLMMGHSLGEMAAAAVAKVFSLEDALGLIVQRAGLMDNTPGSGAMHAISDPALASFGRTAEGITYHDPVIPLISNVSGEPVKSGELDGAYWVRHLKSPVNFAAGMKTLEKSNINIYVEIGPDPALTAMARECVASPERAQWLSCLSQQTPDKDTILDLAGAHFVSGIPVNWHAIHGNTPFRRIPLPTYPFERKRCWVGNGPAPVPTAAPAPPPEAKEAGLPRQLPDSARAYVREIYAQASQVPPSTVKITEPLENYGINSLVINKLNIRLNRDLGEVSKILFFEVRTLDDVAAYLVRHKKGELEQYLKSPAAGTDREAPPARPSNAVQTTASRQTVSRDDIAIIGISGRYPMANTLDEFWDNLCSGKDCITEIPEERWDYRPIFHPDPDRNGTIYCKWGSFIPDIDTFDPLFFNISPTEAAHIDPQERLFLQMAWEALEHANQKRDFLRKRYNGSVGVFAGVMYGEYQYFGIEETLKGTPLALNASYGSIANRVSYFFDFNGPSMAVDTFCSSSLTAVHMAVESIQRGECDIALAGGINLNIHPNKYRMISQLKMASPSGRCRPFGKGGDGFVPGEGGGIVVLKRRSAAEADRDHIHALIKATATNHGGRTNGYSVPNPAKQAELIRQALKKGNIDPRTISYIEAHGTGTALGDPVEIGGLTKAFDAFTSDRQFCAVGSVKSNIGHLEAASGIASLTKVVRQMTEKKLAPSLHAWEPNPNIDFENTPFYIQNELTEWQNDYTMTDGQKSILPLRAGISSFGAGGANAHLIVEEYIRDEAPPGLYTQGPFVFTLSAKTAPALKTYARRMADWLAPGSTAAVTAPLPVDIAYTVQTGREAMKERLAVIFRTIDELCSTLADFSAGTPELTGLCRGSIGENQDESEPGFSDIDARIREAMETGRLEIIADLWCRGAAVNWELLYTDGSPRKIPLPSHPFSRDRYWFKPSQSAGGKGHETAVALSAGDTCLFQPEWLASALDATTAAPFSGDLLVFEPETALPDDFSVQRAGTGHRTLAASPGNAFEKQTDTHFLINPENPADYGALLDACRFEPETDLAIVHLWSENGFDGNQVETQMQESVFSLFFICREILKRYPEKRIRCLYLFRGHNGMQPIYSAVSGFARSLVQENARMAVKTIVYDAMDQRLRDAVMAELNTPWGGCIELMYRKNRRFTLTLRDGAGSRETPGIAIRQGGVYVITGGGGGIGQLLSRHLASQNRVRIVLCEHEDYSGDTRELMAAIRQKGSEIDIIRTDVSQKSGVDKLIRETKARFGSINGVFHCAGVLNDSLCTAKTKERFDAVIRPKVFGTILLDAALRDGTCDFLFLFSSVVSVIGNPGQCDYAYANRFMADYSISRKGNRPFVVSVNWPLWQGGGMTITQAEKTYLLEKTGMIPMGNRAAMAMVGQALGSPVPGLTVMHGERQRINRFMNRCFPVHHTKAGSGPETEFSEDTTSFLRTVLSDITGVPEDALENSVSFTDLGVNSIMSMKITRRIEAGCGVKLYPNEMLVHDSIAKLAVHVDSQISPARPAAENTKKAGRQMQTKQQQSRRPVAYIFSTPRSGSTLLRVMLMGHSEIFSPPELHLLQYESLGQRRASLEKENTLFLREGFIESVKELKGIPAGDASRIMEDLESKDLPVKAAYDYLRDLCGNRFLVDKSPTYAQSAGTLRKAEQMGTDSVYIFLIRHPLSVMESFVRNGFDRMMGIGGDPWEYAEQLWTQMNANIRDFLADIPDSRKIFLRYEDLVATPEPVVKALCSKLGLSFETALLNPYEGRRMLNGLHEESLTIGDPNFLNHGKIDHGLAASWEKHRDKLALLKPETRALAEEFGYTFDSPCAPEQTPRITLLPAQKAILKRYGSTPLWGINAQVKFRTETPMDLSRFKHAYEKLIQTHTVLRLTFSGSTRAPEISETVQADIPIEAISDMDRARQKTRLAEIEGELAAGIHIESAPLMRLKLVETSENEYVLVSAIHMLIADGRTFEIFMESLFRSYFQEERPVAEKTDGYLDYLKALRQIENSSKLNDHKKFWIGQVPSAPHRFPLNGAGGRPMVGNETVSVVSLTFDDLGITSRKQLGRLFYTVSTGLYAALGDRTGNNNPVIFHRLHRRNLNHYGVFADAAGRFAGDFPLCLPLTEQVGGKGGDEKWLIDAFQEKFSQVPLQGLTYELLTDKREIEVDESGFLLLNFQPDIPRLNGLVDIKWRQYESGSLERRYLMDLIVRVKKTSLTIISKYSENVLKKETADEFVAAWTDRIKTLVSKDGE